MVLQNPELNAGVPLMVDVNPAFQTVKPGVHAVKEARKLVHRRWRRRRCTRGSSSSMATTATWLVRTGISSSRSNLIGFGGRCPDNPNTVHLVNETTILQVVTLQVDGINSGALEGVERNHVRVGQSRNKMSAENGARATRATTASAELER